MTDNIKLPEFPLVQVPRIDADIDLMDIRTLSRWCQSVARDYAREAVRLNATVPAQPLDLSVMELAESVGLIGPASRTHDLHDAIQRFHDLIVANASIKAALHFADGLAQPSHQPLTDEQIYRLYRRAGLEAYHLRDALVLHNYDKCINRFARAIEQAHGIGGKND